MMKRKKLRELKSILLRGLNPFYDKRCLCKGLTDTLLWDHYRDNFIQHLHLNKLVAAASET